MTLNYDDFYADFNDLNDLYDFTLSLSITYR